MSGVSVEVVRTWCGLRGSEDRVWRSEYMVGRTGCGGVRTGCRGVRTGCGGSKDRVCRSEDRLWRE